MHMAKEELLVYILLVLFYYSDIRNLVYLASHYVGLYVSRAVKAVSTLLFVCMWAKHS